MGLNSKFLIGVSAVFDLNPGSFFKPLRICISLLRVCVRLYVSTLNIYVSTRSFLPSSRLFTLMRQFNLWLEQCQRRLCGTRDRLLPLSISCNLITYTFIIQITAIILASYYTNTFSSSPVFNNNNPNIPCVIIT